MQHGPKKPLEPYLETDLGEQRELAAQHPGLVARLEVLLEEALR